MRHRVACSVIVALALAGAAVSAAAPLTIGQPAPEIAGAGWINSPPLTLAALPVAVQVHGHPGVGPDVSHLLPLAKAVHEEGPALPQEPDGRGLGLAVPAHAGQPDDDRRAQPLVGPSVFGVGGIEQAHAPSLPVPAGDQPADPGAGSGAGQRIMTSGAVGR